MMWADPYAYRPTCNTEGNIEGKQYRPRHAFGIYTTEVRNAWDHQYHKKGYD